MPGITGAFGTCLMEAGAVCFEDQGHPSGVEIEVQGSFEGKFNVVWPEVTDQVKRCWNDLEVTTENGAYGVAFLLTRFFTGFTVIERSRKGTGFDYWLGHEDDLPFQNKARLEVSGIRNGDEKEIKSRVNLKLKQVQRTAGLPVYVAIIEFSNPTSRMIER